MREYASEEEPETVPYDELTFREDVSRESVEIDRGDD
jgi:hypothetical protein